MILFFADGRLGNQIFQYAFLKSIAQKNEKIIVLGFEDLKEVFEINDVLFLNKKNRWLRVFLIRICKPVLNFLVSCNAITSITVNYEIFFDKYSRETTTFSKHQGFFNFFTFVKLGFFQSEKFFDKNIAEQLKIKHEYLDEANRFLQLVPSNVDLIFVHIRRGDYKDYKIYGKNTILPVSYFKKQIEWFCKNRENSFFIFLSDEPEFIEKNFDYVENKIISINNNFGTDLAIMTKCKSAILSPSSFGWWGSYFIKEKDTIFAPKYWQGFNSNEEFHSCPLANYMTGVEVCVGY